MVRSVAQSRLDFQHAQSFDPVGFGVWALIGLLNTLVPVVFAILAADLNLSGKWRLLALACGLATKLITPFVNLSLPTLVKVLFVVVLYLVAFIVAGVRITPTAVVLAVCVSSVGVAWGEVTFIGYAGMFPSRTAVAGWSVGNALSFLVCYQLHDMLIRMRLSGRMAFLVFVPAPFLVLGAFGLVESNLARRREITGIELVRPTRLPEDNPDSHHITFKMRRDFVLGTLLVQYIVPFTAAFACREFLQLMYGKREWFSVALFVGALLGQGSLPFVRVQYFFPGAIVLVSIVLLALATLPTGVALAALGFFAGVTSGLVYANAFDAVHISSNMAWKEFALGFLTVSTTLGALVGHSLGMALLHQ